MRDAAFEVVSSASLPCRLSQVVDANQALSPAPPPAAAAAAAGRAPGTPQAQTPGARPQSAIVFGKRYVPADSAAAAAGPPSSPLAPSAQHSAASVAPGAGRQRPLSAAAAAGRARAGTAPANAQRGSPNGPASGLASPGAASPAHQHTPSSAASRPPSQLGRGGAPRASPRVLVSPSGSLYGGLSGPPGTPTPNGHGAGLSADIRTASGLGASVLGSAAGAIASGQAPARQLQRYVEPPSPPVSCDITHFSTLSPLQAAAVSACMSWWSTKADLK